MPERYPAALVEYMRGRGAKRVLYGSNYPMLQHQQNHCQTCRMFLLFALSMDSLKDKSSFVPISLAQFFGGFFALFPFGFLHLRVRR